MRFPHMPHGESISCPPSETSAKGQPQTSCSKLELLSRDGGRPGLSLEHRALARLPACLPWGEAPSCLVRGLEGPAGAFAS